MILSVLAHLIFRLHGLRDSQLWGKKNMFFLFLKSIKVKVETPFTATLASYCSF